MRAIAFAAIWFGLAFGVTGVMADAIETWRTASHDPYAEWVPPGSALAEAPVPATAPATRSRTPRAER